MITDLILLMRRSTSASSSRNTTADAITLFINSVSTHRTRCHTLMRSYFYLRAIIIQSCSLLYVMKLGPMYTPSLSIKILEYTDRTNSNDKTTGSISLKSGSKACYVLIHIITIGKVTSIPIKFDEYNIYVISESALF